MYFRRNSKIVAMEIQLIWLSENIVAASKWLMVQHISDSVWIHSNFFSKFWTAWLFIALLFIFSLLWQINCEANHVSTTHSTHIPLDIKLIFLLGTSKQIPLKWRSNYELKSCFIVVEKQLNMAPAYYLLPTHKQHHKILDFIVISWKILT